MHVSTLKQTYVALSASLSLFTAGCWIGWPSITLREIMNGEAHLTATSDQISWIVALLDLGNILSPIPSGYLADSLGRKKTLLLTALLFFSTWILAIFAHTVEYLFLARIGAGIGKGITFTVIPMYLGEIAGVNVRGALSTMSTVFLGAGALFVYSIGPFVSYNVLNVISSSFPIIFFFTFVWLPETPYFHLMKDHKKEALKTLAWLRNTNVTDDILTNEFNAIVKTVDMEIKSKGGCKALFTTTGNRKALTIVLTLAALQRFGGVSSLIAYSTITLPKTGGYFSLDLYMIIFCLTIFIGHFIGAALMDTWGRKPLLIVSCFLCGTSTGILTAFYYWSTRTDFNSNFNWIPYLSLLFYGIAYGMGIGIVPSIFVGELFQTNIKSLASAITAMCFAIGSFATNKTYLFIANNYGVHYMYGFFTISFAISIAFTFYSVIETKGQTFGQIQDKLNKTRGNCT